MPQTPQTYQNHRRNFPLFHFFVVPIFLINVLGSAWMAIQTPVFITIWGAVMAVALLGLALATRLMITTVQDRLIRLEMRLRMADVLPADLKGRINELERSQFVALRFASDAELPDLVRDVLAGNLKSSNAIKQRVKNWQGDYLRA
jgi:hypothetical protein